MKRRIVIISCLLLTCCAETWTERFKRADSKLIYGNRHDGWTLVKENTIQGSAKSYSIMKHDGDTAKFLFFDALQGGPTLITLYKKRFPCNQMDTCYLEMDSQDTAFFYSKGGKLKTFYVGEYAYRASYMTGMTSNERSFYLEHEDSLRRVKGNNLPPLPILKMK